MIMYQIKHHRAKHVEKMEQMRGQYICPALAPHKAEKLHTALNRNSYTPVSFRLLLPKALINPAAWLEKRATWFHCGCVTTSAVI